MKAIISILFLLPLFCFAQEEKSKTNAPVKQSTTDCPTWKKKGQKTDKAAYFKALRSKKTMANQQSSVANTNNYRDSKIQPNSSKQKTDNSNPAEKNRKTEKLAQVNTKRELAPSKNTSTNSDAEEKNKVTKQKKTLENKEELAKSTEKPEEKNKISKQKKAEENKEELAKSTVKPEEKNTKEDGMTASGSDDKKTEKPDNSKPENSKLKKKLERMSRKTTKVKKHSNAKCPSF